MGLRKYGWVAEIKEVDDDGYFPYQALGPARGDLMDTSKKTIILFSGDFDKVMAALIIANGAAAMGDDVTIFCTFWGLNILRKTEKVAGDGKKSTLQSMFGRMMPKGTKKLGLSKMNFAGAGAP